MATGRPVLRVGLTGGIASGKSTVGRVLTDLGALVVDADALSRDVMAPGGAAFDEVVRRFGDEILNRDGRIDREVLAQRVFGDSVERRALEAIVHPAIRDETERRFAAHGTSGPRPVAVFDAALLVETGAYRAFHRLIVVHCDETEQIRRIRRRDGLTEEQARDRIRAQAPIEDKLAAADYVIDTGVPVEQTRSRTGEVWAELLEDYERLL